ncbi:hypothetical protein [Scytonema sp. NUACC26]|uniref:hypothetical protein n=1 Tax=Scytonema sp. NUACC26 TaxID=3140176 RepID=UPI0038B26D75
MNLNSNFSWSQASILRWTHSSITLLNKSFNSKWTTNLESIVYIELIQIYLLLVLVGEARIVMRRHTIAQAIAGPLLGIVLTAIQLLFFKLA